MIGDGYLLWERGRLKRSFEAVRGKDLKTNVVKRVGLLTLAAVVAACGGSPLQGLGQGSSEWMNEPEIVTTTVPPVTTPAFIDVVSLAWSNDEIVNESLSDPEAPEEDFIAEVFGRRQGDRFIQASREEIAAALPLVEFPSRVPFGAEWVSSQLVIENSGRLSNDPSAAFGIWSAEPYTRSRSVAQMAVLRVAIDPDTAAEVAATGDEVTCARFEDRTADLCEIVELDGKLVWRLSDTTGTTLIWFDRTYRYELYGRDFIPLGQLQVMASNTILLSELEPISS